MADQNMENVQIDLQIKKNRLIRPIIKAAPPVEVRQLA